MLDASAAAQSALPSDASTPSLELSSRKYLSEIGRREKRLGRKRRQVRLFLHHGHAGQSSGGIQQTYAGWERIRGTIDINFDKMIQWQDLAFTPRALAIGANLGGRSDSCQPERFGESTQYALGFFWVQQLFLHNRVRIRADSWPVWILWQSGIRRYLAYRALATRSAICSVPYSSRSTRRHAWSRDLLCADESFLREERRHGRQPESLSAGSYRHQLRNSQFCELSVEAGYLTGRTYPGEYKFGGVYNGGRFPNPAGIESSGNYLIYGMASQALYRLTPVRTAGWMHDWL